MKKKFTFLIMALFALIASPGRAEVVSGTTYETKSTSSLPDGWTGNGGGTSYIQLTSSSNHITTDNFIQNGFTSIVLKARKYGGPSDAQALITVSWYDAATSNETVLGTIAPTSTTLTNYTISSPTNPTGNTSGYIKIQCKGASSGKGSGVSQVTITYTAGTSTDPSITVNPTTITWNDSPINEELSETISVSQANLTEGITISSTIGTVTPSTIAAGEDATDVTFTYTPTSVGDFEGEITFTSGETTATVSVTGSAYDPSQVDTYELFTGDLVEGDYVIYYSSYAMKNTVASNRLQNLSVTPDNNAITNPDAAIVWHIAQSGDYWTIYNDNIEKYAAGTTAKNQAALIDAITDYAKWTVTASNGTYEFVNLGRSNATSDPGNKYLRNNGINGWACYASATGGALTLYKKVNSSSVATPTFTPAGGTYATAQNVTISCATEDASIYYTLDGTTPTDASTRYTSAITVSETKTIKAIAYSQTGETSSVASATYTIAAPLTTMDAIFAKATAVGSTATEVEVTFNYWVISGVKSSNAYLTDNNGKGLIIYTSSHGFEVGDILSGTAACKVQLYNGAAELTTLTSSTDGLTVTKGGSVIAQEASIADLSGVNTGAVITLNNVTYSGSDNIFTDGEGKNITAYNTFMTLPEFNSNRQYNITGVYIQYKETKEIAPRTNDDIEEIVPTEPSITVAETLELPYTESEETLEVIYQNIDFDNIDINLYDDAGCTTDFTGDWFIAEFDDQFNIEYLAEENKESTLRTVYIEIYAIGTDGENDITKVITVTQAGVPQTYTVTLSSNGVVGKPQPVQGSITLSDPTNIPTGFTFAGWTESESNIQFVANPYTPTSVVTLYAVFSREEGAIAGSGNYEKVTSNPEDWSGEYLIVYENGANSFAFDGSLQTLDATNNSISVQIENNSIESNSTTNAAKFTIEPVNGGYSIQSSSGYYIGRQAKSNGISTSKTNAFINVLTYTESTIKVTNYYASENLNNYLKYNSNNDQKRFRYFTSDSQNDIQLYKKDEGTPGVTKYYTRVFDEDTELASLTVAGPSIILSGYTLTVTGTMSNTNPANLIIEDGAQLILNEKNIGVMATVKKQIEASNTHTGEPVDKWYTIGSPVKEPIINGSTGNYVADIIPAGGMSALTYDLYYLDMTAGTWINYRQEGDTPGFTTLENGRGYIYSNQSATTVKYVGELNTANVNRSVNTGWNLVSNPFAQTIAFRNFELDNSASMVGYYSLDGAGGWQAEPITTVVASNTGILVNVPEGASSIEISKPAEAIENNGAKRGDSNDNAYAYIEINVANANYSDRAYAAFAEGYGLPKYDHINAEIQKVYIPQGGEDFAIAFMDENITLFPLSFKAMTTGYYTISLKSSQIYEGYNDFDYLHLIDNMTGEEIDMLMEDSYKFAASPKDNAGRFTVKLHRNGIEENDIENINFVYQNGNELVINGEGTFQLIDMLGRVVISKEVHGETVNVGSLNTGAYIVRMTGENVMTQKIVIK